MPKLSLSIILLMVHPMAHSVPWSFSPYVVDRTERATHTAAGDSDPEYVELSLVSHAPGVILSPGWLAHLRSIQLGVDQCALPASSAGTPQIAV